MFRLSLRTCHCYRTHSRSDRLRQSVHSVFKAELLYIRYRLQIKYLPLSIISLTSCQPFFDSSRRLLASTVPDRENPQIQGFVSDTAHMPLLPCVQCIQRRSSQRPPTGQITTRHDRSKSQSGTFRDFVSIGYMAICQALFILVDRRKHKQHSEWHEIRKGNTWINTISICDHQFVMSSNMQSVLAISNYPICTNRTSEPLLTMPLLLPSWKIRILLQRRDSPLLLALQLRLHQFLCHLLFSPLF